MSKREIKSKELKNLNSKLGLRKLFRQKEIDLESVLADLEYDEELRRFQIEMVKVQKWVIENRKKLLVIFEGRDAAGKGGVINAICSHINPRHYRKVALNKPSKEESGQWYFQRYVNYLPNEGEMIFFDRSWYNRAVVEPVNGFCTEKEYNTFMGQVNEFERMILESDIIFLKFFLKISKEEQSRRLSLMKKDPLRNWRLTPVDKNAQKLWKKYSAYEDEMFKNTQKKNTKWQIIDADNGPKARLESLRILLDSVPYK